MRYSRKEWIGLGVAVALILGAVAVWDLRPTQPTPEAALRSIHDPKPGDDEVVGYVAHFPILRGAIRIETEWRLKLQEVRPSRHGMDSERALHIAVERVVNDLLMDEEVRRRGYVVDQQGVEEHVAFNIKWVLSLSQRYADLIRSRSGSTADNYPEYLRENAPRWNLHGQLLDAHQQESPHSTSWWALWSRLQRSIQVTWIDPVLEEVYQEIRRESEELYPESRS